MNSLPWPISNNTWLGQECPKEEILQFFSWWRWNLLSSPDKRCLHPIIFSLPCLPRSCWSRILPHLFGAKRRSNFTLKGVTTNYLITFSPLLSLVPLGSCCIRFWPLDWKGFYSQMTWSTLPSRKAFSLEWMVLSSIPFSVSAILDYALQHNLPL